jgi:hypothetical protein
MSHLGVALQGQQKAHHTFVTTGFAAAKKGKYVNV